MENLANKNQCEKHYAELEGMKGSIDKRIDEQVGIVYDELKGYIESLVYGGKVNFTIMDREARFEYALANLKSMVFIKHRPDDLNKIV